MKFKKKWILFMIVLMGILIVSQVSSLLANYNIVEDIRITMSNHSLLEGETLVISVSDQNIEDRKLVIPVDENIEYSSSDYQDASVVFDSINHQVVIDWLDPSNEQKKVSISLKLNKKGIYPIKALTVREKHEVSTKEENIEVVAANESKEEDLNTDSSKNLEQRSAEEPESTLWKSNSPDAIKTGIWGTAPYEFNEGTGELMVKSGEIISNKPEAWLSRGIDSKLIKKIIFLETVYAPADSYRLFAGAYYDAFFKLEEITGLNYLNTSNVTSMDGMFNDSRLSNIDVSNFDTSKVTNMNSMFRNVEKVKSLDVSNFDTSKVTDMAAMFATGTATDIDVSNFDTSKVTNMDSMFSDNKTSSDIDVSKFDTSQVTNMNFMFYGIRLDKLDISNFDTSKVTIMSSMFRRSSLKELDLSGFDTSSVVKSHNMSSMLSGMALRKLVLGSKFKLTPEVDMALAYPFDRTEESSGKWIREGRTSKAYTPDDFMLKYMDGESDLVPGTYVAETALPAEIKAETTIVNQTHSDDLFYVNDEVKIENVIHHKGDVYNFIYKTIIPDEVIINDRSFKGYSITKQGHKIDFPSEAFKFDESNRTLEINLKSIVEPEEDGNYCTAVDTDFYYDITGIINKNAIGKNLEIKTSIDYFNNILKYKKNVSVSTEEKRINGLEAQWQLIQRIKNVSRSDNVTAVGDELEFTITATNSETLGAMKSFDLVENQFPEELDFVSNSAELILPDGMTKKLPNSVYQPSKQTVSINVYAEYGYVGTKPYQLRFKAKIKDTAYEKTLEMKAYLKGVTNAGKELSLEADRVKLNVAYSGKLGFKEIPRTLSFKDSFLSVFTSTIERKDENWGIAIEDTRLQKQPWSLSVKQSTPFETTEGDTLTQILFFRKNGEEDRCVDTKNEVDVYSEDVLNTNNYYISWSKSEGFFLKVPPGIAKAKQYQTELQWNLKDTPI